DDSPDRRLLSAFDQRADHAERVGRGTAGVEGGSVVFVDPPTYRIADRSDEEKPGRPGRARHPEADVLEQAGAKSLKPKHRWWRAAHRSLREVEGEVLSIDQPLETMHMLDEIWIGPRPDSDLRANSNWSEAEVHLALEAVSQARSVL